MLVYRKRNSRWIFTLLALVNGNSDRWRANLVYLNVDISCTFMPTWGAERAVVKRASLTIRLAIILSLYVVISIDQKYFYVFPYMAIHSTCTWQ